MKFQHKTQMLHRKSSFENSVDSFTTFKFHKIIKSREITRALIFLRATSGEILPRC